MELRKLFYLLLILPILFLQTSCSEDKVTEPEPTIVEAEELVKYFEGDGGDFINTAAPAMTTAEAVKTNLGASQYIIDIRSQVDFEAGHIQGAVNVSLKNIVDHVKTLNKTGAYDRIVIACYTGQTAGYATALLRLLGYNNVYDLKWGGMIFLPVNG